VLERYERLGLQPHLAAEYEFVVFRESEDSAMEKGFRGLRPLAPRTMIWGALQSTMDDEVIGPIVKALDAMRVPVEGWLPEGAPGQYEINMKPAPALEAADRAFLFKQGVKEMCALNGLLATFMPKLAAGQYGSSLHVHQSLWSSGRSAFYDADSVDHMAPAMRWFIAGQLRTLIPFAPIWLPTPPAYKRILEPHSAAGTTATWGPDNKSLSLRVLAPTANRCRIEHRVPGADANVYLVFAAMLAGGLYGIENQLELPPPTVGDAYTDAELMPLPKTLEDAVAGFETDAIAREYLGEEFVRYYAATRRWEVEKARQEITDCELMRYFIRS
jgi:glutamine synthetase